MSARSITLAGRRAAARLMVDTCTITRVTGATTDPDTGVVTDTTTTVYSGACRIQAAPAASREVQPGEATRLMTRLELQLPMDATGVASDDVVTIDSSALDGDLVGRAFVARGLSHKTHAVMRRLEIEEVTS